MARVRLARGASSVVRALRALPRAQAQRRHAPSTALIADARGAAAAGARRARRVLAGLVPCIRCSALVWNVGVLYLLMGFRRFSHALSAIVEAFRENDVAAARRALAAWRGGSTAELSSQDIARLAIERGLVDAYRQVFAVLFWFAVLPGPAGAVLYRAALLLAQEWRGGEPGDDETPIVRSRERRSARRRAGCSGCSTGFRCG